MRFILGMHRGARRYREVQGGMQRCIEGEMRCIELHRVAWIGAEVFAGVHGGTHKGEQRLVR